MSRRELDQQLIDEARTWIGVPFLHQGRTRQGVDCVGLVIACCTAVGRIPEYFERIDYGRNASRPELITKIARYCKRIEALEPACLLTLCWGKFPSHVAIYTGDSIIHAYGKRGINRVVETGYRGPWPKVTTGAWRLPDKVL